MNNPKQNAKVNANATNALIAELGLNTKNSKNTSNSLISDLNMKDVTSALFHCYYGFSDSVVNILRKKNIDDEEKIKQILTAIETKLKGEKKLLNEYAKISLSHLKIEIEQINNDQNIDKSLKLLQMLEVINEKCKGSGLNYQNLDDYIRGMTTKAKGGAPKKPKKKPSSAKSTYKRTESKHKDSKGKEYTIYKKGDKKYIKKLSKSTGKFTYRAI